MTSDQLPEKIGMIAGWGLFPVVVAEALERSGVKVYCLGVKGHPDERLREICTYYRELGLGRFGTAFRIYKKFGLHHLVMLGKIHKKELFKRNGWWCHLPDLRTLRMFASHFLFRSKNNKDDSLANTVIAELEKEGIEVVAPTDFAPELLAQKGQLTSRAPNDAQWKDIHFGWELAKKLGELDCGQCVVVKDQAVLALEAIEGTDLCIRRAGELCKAGGFTVVKTAKPQQDMRNDAPTVGTQTLESIIVGGGKVLVIEAEKTILLEKEAFIQMANKHKLVVVVVDEEELGKRVTS